MLKSANRLITVHVPGSDGIWKVYGSYDHELAAVAGATEALASGAVSASVCTTMLYLAKDNLPEPLKIA